jgi:diazepam-binding inhibitor (GABA receptor modulating acyl-CoA-binding protein)
MSLDKKIKKLELEIEFEEYCQKIKKAPQQTNEILLELYGLYKQSKEGDCNKDEPSFYLLKEKAKYNAWKNLEGIKKDEAMKRYIQLCKSLLAIKN